MSNYLKPLKAGKPRAPASSSSYERIGEDEKPFLAEGVSHNPRLQLEDQRLKRRIRWLKFVSRVLAFLISVAVLGMIGNTGVTYYKSKDLVSDTNMSPWPETPKLWPTIMMFSVSAMALIGNFIVLISYCCGQKASNKAANVNSFISIVDRIIHIVAWGISAGLFRQQCGLGGDHDLWAWTCSTAADERQSVFKDVVNYDFLCMSNSMSWYISLGNVGLGIITFVLYMMAIKRIKNKKNIQRAQAAGGIRVPA